MRLLNPVTAAVTVAAFCLSAAYVAPAHAKEPGDWIVRAGATNISPKSDNGLLDADQSIGIDVSSATMFTFDVSRMFTDNIAVELLAALPFKHDVSLEGLGDVASVKHLPPTLSAQYHFNPTGTVSPYIGLGINWTIFFDEKSKGALSGADIDASNSLGLAAQAGIDWAVSDAVLLNATIRWMSIETDVKVDGARAAALKIDPIVFGLNIGYKF